MGYEKKDSCVIKNTYMNVANSYFVYLSDSLEIAYYTPLGRVQMNWCSNTYNIWQIVPGYV